MHFSTTAKWARTALAAAFSVFAAVQCGGGSGGGTDEDGGMSDAGVGTGDAAQDPGLCRSGELGCPCDAGACTMGECVSDTCVDCQRGESACVCRSNGSCNAGLRCEMDECVDCPEGSDGCPCLAGDVCDGQFVCTSGVCAPSACVPGSDGCPCRAADPECDASLACGTDSICRACATDVPGCPCDASNTCSGGLVCENGMCRDAVTCADLVADGACDPNQACTEASGGNDAACVPQMCIVGYTWNTTSASCEPCGDAGCAPPPTCLPGAPGSIADDCASQLMECVDDASGVRCEGCVNGTVDQGGTCVPIIECGGTVCADTEYCDRTDTTCRALPCPQPQAQDAQGICQDCTITCTGAGRTGRIWPFRSVTGVCLCETLPDFFVPAGGTGDAVACDADRDGWVREEADDAAVNADPALWQNARCTIQTVDDVRLENEYGQARVIGVCTNVGFVVDPDSTSCPDRLPLRLLETLRNDVPGRPTGNQAPVYGPNGRELDARELNSLTKACVTLPADFNDDGTDDILEVQQTPPPASTNDREWLQSFAYFIELYRSYYEAPGATESHGTLVVRERSRCNADDFPLRYDSTVVDPLATPIPDEYDPDKGGTYWRSCTRFVDPAYPTSIGEPGFDFAQWACDPSVTTCSLPPPHATIDATSIDPAQTLLRGHGLCELNGAVPADGIWRGMNHHSQFKCVNVTDTPTNPVDRPPDEFDLLDPTATLALNVCEAAVCDPADTSCMESQPTGGLGTYEPVLHCTVWDGMGTPPTTVGFAAVRYQAYGSIPNGYTVAGASYGGGCVNEDAEYTLDDGTTVTPLLCPYPEFSTELETDAFGRYSCYGDGSNYLWSDGTLPPARDTLVFGGSNGSVWR